MEHEVWDVLQRHLDSIFNGDVRPTKRRPAKTCRCLSGGSRLIARTASIFTAS